MANPLDDITTTRDDEGRPLRRVYITGNDDAPVGDPMGGGISMPSNKLEQAVAPEAPTDIMALIGKVREYLTGGVDPMQRLGDVMTTAPALMLGPREPGTERQQLWPEKMVRSGATLPGEVAQGRVPMFDPDTGRTSVEAIERAQDTAGLAFPGALAQRPGTATLGSGPVRRKTLTQPEFENLSPREQVAYSAENPFRIEKSEAGHIQLYGTPDVDVRVIDPMTKEVKFQDSGPGSWQRAQEFWRKNSKPTWDVITGDTSGYYMPVMRFPSKRAAEKWVEEHGGSRMAPGNSTLMSDSSTPGSGVAAVANSTKGPAPVFYSALEHVVTNAAQDTMSPQQWAGFLKNQPGVKAEELAWTGIGDWLAEQKGPVKKADVQRYLDEHKVEIKDVTKHQDEYLGSKPGDDDFHDIVMGEAQAYYDAHPALERTHGDIDTWLETPAGQQVQTNIERNLNENYEGVTKYSDYQLPGGENYREHLLTMPQKKAPSEKFLEDNPNISQWTKTQKEEFNRLEAKEAVNPDYRSSHWDEPNVLAHVRMNDRVVDGKKALHIEEIQSDWHQQGRKQGYKGEEIPPARKALIDERDKLASEVADIQHNIADYGRDPDYISKMERITELNRRVNQPYGQELGVPDAPFKTTWPELALKRMIREAAEKGYDRVSWTPGDAQAARYDLSKTVRSVAYNPNTGYFKALDKNGRDISSGPVPKEKLADTIGKDAADKLLKQEPNNLGIHTLEGEELKVGGEGMREFYDKMLPKMVEKIGKAHGVKVQKATIDTPNPDAGWMSGEKAMQLLKDDPEWKIPQGDEAQSAWFSKLSRDKRDKFMAAAHKLNKKTIPHDVFYFDLPPTLRDQAVGKGFPLYMSGIPFPLTPVDYDPFKQEK